MLLNIRSIKNKLNELEIFLEELNKKPSIIIITESWLKNEEVKYFNLKNYQSLGNCRTNQRGGGIIFFINDNLNYNVIKNEQFHKSHLILINLSDLNIKVAGFYRSPSTRTDHFFEILENTLDKIDNLICCGDANLDLFKINDLQVQKYINILEINNYKLLNEVDQEQYTYSEDKNGHKHTSILDHIFSDKFSNSNEVNIDIREVCFSDHRSLIFDCNLNMGKQITKKQYTKSR